MINNEILENKIPGAVVLVGDNREIIFHKAYGLSNVQFNRAFNINDIFRIASMTKAITAFAVIKLWEKGLIDLDDPIKKYIPEFDKPGILKPITQLIPHIQLFQPRMILQLGIY